ncbi:DUF2092 domain-containing protein [Nitrosomonas sp. Nm34]|uniref:DUF2092 domain-containing protein n=1 Tax=Nitrosomonas sp. Nm34 TaxID=1881055 RepID=UPI0008F24252|nr:DUF2092 domain-containing protein [Nitrosomonas sp. Nm34]SFI17383.1 hypothetical protein SAMN05428978_100144 [Nitrosomonas sp. Nm34]
MKSKRQMRIGAALSLLYLIILTTPVAWAQKQAQEESELSKNSSIGLQIAKEQATAKDALTRMAEFLAKAQKYSVNIKSSYEVLQESGQKIEFGENRKVIVNRPNGLHIEAEHSDGERHLVLYDGRQITVFTPSENVYAQATKLGGIDEAVMYFLRDLGMTLPLALLVTSRLPEELDRRTQTLDYVEETVMDGKPVHHVAGRTETVDYQVWIAEGAKPLPLQIVLTYKNVEGQPDYRAKFSNWNLDPKVKNTLFTFTPPKEARKIAFVAQLPKTVLQGSASPAETGEQK